MTDIDDVRSCHESQRRSDITPDALWPEIGFRRPDELLRRGPDGPPALADDELCVIRREDGDDCYLRATLILPIVGGSGCMVYGPWAQVCACSFCDYCDRFDDPDHRVRYPGGLATAIPGYDDVLGLPLQVVTQGAQRPRLVPEPDVDHPLVRDFYDGITGAEAELRLRSLLLIRQRP